MTELLADLSDRVKSLAGDWTRFTLVGSFVLYALGYLVLRFHLTALGIATDLTVLDERYLFTGARFLVYLVAVVPISLVLAWIVWRVLPMAARQRLSTPAVGIVFALLMIQLIMRQCFLISNVLLAADLSNAPPWLAWLLLNDAYMLLYFSVIVAACAVPIAILAALRRDAAPLARGVLMFLAAVQVLLVPVNYGYLVLDKTLPRVAALGDRPLQEGEDAWLAWEGQKGATYLVRNRATGRRALLTLAGEMKQIEIVAFDPIFPTLFGGSR